MAETNPSLSVLFVDDEPLVLDGLRRLLRGQRHEWRLAFALGGPEALEMMARATPDIVVSDMRMPGMDGAALLAEVRRLYPQVVRIILSGQSDPVMVMKSVLPAHQFLAKPVEAERLFSVLRQTGALRQLLGDQRLLSLVSQIETLPVLPQLFQDLMGLLEQPGADEEEIGRLIGRDMGMASTVLKLVNSAFFGTSCRVIKPAEAVGMLGLDVVRALVLSQNLFDTFDQEHFPHFSFEGLWRHSLAVGGYARAICHQENAGEAPAESAFIAGLLHDVGKLILCTVLPAEYADIIAEVRRDNRRVVSVERQRLGVSHAEVGAYLIGLWGLGQEIVAAIAGHHQPAIWAPAQFSCVTAVHAANVLDKELCIINKDYARSPLDEEHLAGLGLSQRLPVWRQACLGVKECGG
ncbi:MAG: response regulator [Pseudomonadota bacterium]